MRTVSAVALLATAILSFSGTAARAPEGRRAAGTIAATQWPYVPGSVLPVRVEGFSPPYRVALVGPGSMLDGGKYAVPQGAGAGVATLVAGNARGLALRSLKIGPPPPNDRSFVAVVSYDDGIVFHDASAFSVLGILATGGTPSDGALDARGRFVAPDTQGGTITVGSVVPWSVSHVDGVPLGDDVAIDANGTIFVSNRDLDGTGALTRVATDGTVSHVTTGQTAEGLAIDPRRNAVYVANVNDGTISEVDASSMRVRRTFPAIERVFSITLSPDGTHLYGISNQSAGSPFAQPGAAILMDLRGAKPRIVARSGKLEFPLGEALDSATNTLFVTDESLDVIDVLDARTLRAKRAPLATCHTPWKPHLDVPAGRLYVPCARDGRVDVFTTRDLKRVAGAPFATGGYPLAVMVWHPRGTANRSSQR